MSLKNRLDMLSQSDETGLCAAPAVRASEQLP